jgi:hypothetical protein
MLLNPNQSSELLHVIPGTRVLQNQLGLLNAVVDDPKQSGRYWRVCAVYAPIPGRAIGGIRVKLMDQKGFISFCNQRDFELLIDLAKPNGWCPWLDALYPGVNDEEEGWVGLCMDPVDMLDDLYERELLLRAQQPSGILQPQEVLRRLHTSPTADVEQLDLLLWDADPHTGMGPDVRMETVEYRWRCSEKRKVQWSRL